jgi:hypothetical protein
MDRLSGLDASFLYLETPEQLMHVCGLMVLDPATMPDGYDFDSFQARINARVSEVSAFTRKLRRVPLGLDHPVWVRDRHFDIERHVYGDHRYPAQLVIQAGAKAHGGDVFLLNMGEEIRIEDLAKHLIRDRQFTGDQIARIWDLSDGCGGTSWRCSGKAPGSRASLTG